MYWGVRKMLQKYQKGKRPKVTPGPIKMQLIGRATRGNVFEWIRAMAGIGVQDIIAIDLPDHIRHYGGNGQIEYGKLQVKEDNTWWDTEHDGGLVLSLPVGPCLLIGEHYHVQADDGVWTIEGIIQAVGTRFGVFVACKKVATRRPIFNKTEPTQQPTRLIIT